jgi:hypothetical protein
MVVLHRAFLCSIVMVAFLAMPIRSEASILIDFESFSDGDPVTGIGGASFANATVLTAGISLNEFDFPPLSPQNVAFDDGGAMVIVFSSTVSSFSAFFTYAAPLTLEAFDAGNNPLGSAASAFSNNLGTTGELGSSPNEQLSVASPGIKSVTITGDPAGGSFAVDNVEFEPEGVPEPAVLLLLGTAAAAVARRRLKA